MARTSRKRAWSAAGGVAVALPIVPMLDMAFQLLFFFVVSFHPQALEGALECGVKGTPAGNQPRPPDPDGVDLPDRIRVVVKHSSGEGVVVDSLLVQTNEGEWPLADLPALGRFLRERRSGPDSTGAIQVAAEGKLKFSRVVEVVDVCRKAGYEKVSFATPPDA